MTRANELIAEAEKWVGYLEKESNENLNNFTANAGSNNYTRFAVDYCDYFGEKKTVFQAQPWCAMFVSVVFANAFGAETAEKLLGGHYAYCPYGVKHFKEIGIWKTENPKPGDVIIIDKETFNKVQEILRQRAEAVPTYPFTKKIVCGTCGHLFTRKKGKVKGKTYIHWICRSKKEVGITCSSVNFTEEELEKISAQMMGIAEFDSEGFEETVKLITVEKNGDLRYQLSDGSVKVWKNLHLHPKQHEVTVTDCFQGKIVCAHCGNIYHRVVSGGRWVYWYCMGKKKKDAKCNNINYADFQLRRISASILGLSEFKENVFERSIEKIVVLEDGSLEYHFYEGRTETWQRM